MVAKVKVAAVEGPRVAPRWSRLAVELVVTAAVVAMSTAVAWVFFGRQSLPDVAMIYLLGVVAVAMRLSFPAAILATVLSVAAYDFLFFPPYLSFIVYEVRHVVTFGVMFVVAVIISTLTRRIRAQSEEARLREQSNARLWLEVETERMQSSILSSVSHDLRTPLAVITGASTTLLAEPRTLAPVVERDLLSAIHEESVRLTRLVENLLEMTRLTAGAVRLEKTWQSVEAIIGAAIRRVEPRVGGRILAADVPPDLPLAPFDAVLIEQVLVNLVENAAKYSPAGAPVEVRARATGAHEIAIEVADRGRGVHPSERSRIFEKFYRSPGEHANGAGLGLAICRGIVTAHGGRIDVEQREGGGAVFRFTLPLEGTPPVVEEDGP